MGTTLAALVQDHEEGLRQLQERIGYTFRDLQLLQEPGSRRNAPELLTAIWSAGQVAGYPQFVAEPMPEALIDDHVALTRVGVPSILIIDYRYPAWHTHADDLDQVDAASLEAVGETLRVALRALWP